MNRLIRVTMHGAVSVVNAVANGHGSALGISLKVVADLSISAGRGIHLQSKQGEKSAQYSHQKSVTQDSTLRQCDPG